MLSGQPATPASDVYSFGAMAYEVLTLSTLPRGSQRMRDPSIPPWGSGSNDLPGWIVRTGDVLLPKRGEEGKGKGREDEPCLTALCCHIVLEPYG